PNYFGNMGKDHIRKNLIFADTFRLSISSFQAGLIDQLARHLKEFFILHNFGTRQSKGFGSFTIGENLVEQLTRAVDFSFVIDTSAQLGKATHKDYNQMNSHQQSVCSLFTQIELFYKSLRSGINTGERSGKTRFYIKPAIFHYAKDVLNQQWDKKSIKATYLGDHLQSQKQKYPQNEVLHFESRRSGRHHLLLKDLFGLSSLESWRSYEATVKKTHPGKVIDRLQSPFTFIPVRTGKSKYTVGVKISETPGRFLNQTFDIQFKGSRRLQLTTPDHFDWNDFMKYLRNDIPPLEERSESNQGLTRQPEYQILSNIYDQIK
ncbi:MAG: hypothetical protein WBA74_18575, partial [Cyclobacteriaceae bacterium]